MSRWKASAACSGCGAVPPKGVKLTVDKQDGGAYCAACWESYYGVAAPAQAPRPERGRAAQERQERASRGKLAKPQPGGVANSADWRVPAAAAPVAAEPALEPRTLEEATATGHAAAAGKPAPEAETPAAAQQEEAVVAMANSPVAGPAARFARELEALQQRQQLAAEIDSQRVEEARAQQQEELEALSSIYGEALEMLSSEAKGPAVLRLSLPPEVDGDGEVEVMVRTAEGEEVPAGRIQNLPPLVLQCALPELYPLEEVPVFALEADYLDAGTLSDCEGLLRSLSEGRSGDPVLFEWTTALQEHLHISERLVLKSGDATDAMGVALRLLAHDRSVRDERRNRETQRCPMCFDEMPGSRGLFLACGHFGCRDCLTHMVQLHMKEADVAALRCPTADCREGFGREALREVLGEDSSALERWDELSLRRCLDQMQDIVDCPRCLADAGQRTPCIVEEDNMAQCEACGFIFCGRCRGVYHPGADCSSVMGDRMEALEARAAKSGPDGEAARAELLTLRHLQRNTKSCPKCKMAIEKTEGCSKMKCSHCNVYFCWRCGKVINGYDHFATSDCRLFDDEEIRRWNQNWRQQVDRAQARAHEARFLAQFVDAEQLGKNARECPRCRTVNLKEGRNNHMKCYACLTHFCGRCMEILPKNHGADHFNRLRICPQHSDD